MGRLASLADVSDPRSLANRFRARRFRRFAELLPSGRPLSLLVVGGTVEFWRQRGWLRRPDLHIVVYGMDPGGEAEGNLEVVEGDATCLPYPDGAFDVVFSNSVIEHLAERARQRQMAREVMRVGKAYWVQTPNYWFPVEPHFLVPGWQWLPEAVRVELLRRLRLGRRGPYADRQAARESVREIRLLTRRELADLFPGAALWPERLFGLVKSWVAYAGFDGLRT
ncbi:MAG: class I SAM-dependent methyltransferase [Deltaproteobacteria bacterium]|nr:MAG: class I SAM-dependent methyltransferase [Deltaproteobacteria bacterium]